jgi:hypothetical protein
MSKIWTKRQGICLVDVGTVSDVDVQLVRPSIRGLPGRFLGKFPNPAVCEEKKEGAQWWNSARKKIQDLRQTKFPYLPGRFLGKFPNPAVCEEKKRRCSVDGESSKTQTEFPYSLRRVFNGISRTLLSAKKKNVESSSRSMHHDSSDQVSVLARKVLRKFPNPAVCEEKNVLLIILFAGESQCFEVALFK